jgi:hypothetical protein
MLNRTVAHPVTLGSEVKHLPAHACDGSSMLAQFYRFRWQTAVSWCACCNAHASAISTIIIFTQLLQNISPVFFFGKTRYFSMLT